MALRRPALALASLLALAFCGAIAPAFAQTPVPVPSAGASPADGGAERSDTRRPIGAEDADAIERARAWFLRVQSGDVDRPQLTSRFAAVLTDAIVESNRRQLGPFGIPASIAPGGKFVHAGTTSYIFLVTWPAGRVIYQFTVAPDGRIDGYFVRPAPATLGPAVAPGVEP